LDKHRFVTLEVLLGNQAAGGGIEKAAIEIGGEQRGPRLLPLGIVGAGELGAGLPVRGSEPKAGRRGLIAIEFERLAGILQVGNRRSFTEFLLWKAHAHRVARLEAVALGIGFGAVPSAEGALV